MALKQQDGVFKKHTRGQTCAVPQNGRVGISEPSSACCSVSRYYPEYYLEIHLEFPRRQL